MSDLDLSAIADASDAGTAYPDPARIIALLADPQSRQMAEYILQTDAERHPQTVEALRAALSNDNATVRRLVAKTIAGTLARQEAGAAVGALLGNPDRDVRFGTLTALAGGALPRAETDVLVTALTTVLSDEDLAIRKEAIWTLYLLESGSGAVAIDAAIPALEKSLEEPNTQGNAAIALSLAYHLANDATRAAVLRAHPSGPVQLGFAWGMAEASLRRHDLATLKSMFADEDTNIRRGLGAYLHHAKRLGRDLSVAGQAYLELMNAEPADPLLQARLFAVQEIIERGPPSQ